VKNATGTKDISLTQSIQLPAQATDGIRVGKADFNTLAEKSTPLIIAGCVDNQAATL